MFGYVAPHKCELKLKELAQYQAWYCGLCHAISRNFGQLPRLALNYDCTFLALLSYSVQDEAKEDIIKLSRHCALKPLYKKSPVAGGSDALNYAAAMNVLLARYKLMDDYEDERSVKGFIGSLALKRAANNAASRYGAQADCIKKGIGELGLIERAGEKELDRAAEPFANMLSEIMSGYEGLDDASARILKVIGYYLGRWIYFMDAWEDREKGGYNPFIAAGAGKERASFILYAALNEIEKAYDLLQINAHKGLLDNIMYEGLRVKTQGLMEGVTDESI